jgi:hypothetical protein
MEESWSVSIYAGLFAPHRFSTEGDPEPNISAFYEIHHLSDRLGFSDPLPGETEKTVSNITNSWRKRRERRRSFTVKNPISREALHAFTSTFYCHG